MKIQIKQDSSEPPYKQLVSGIEKLIQSGDLNENEHLPSLAELAAELGISPETVKKAYYLLKKKGILYAQRGLGFYVADKNNAKKEKRVLMLLDRLDSYKLHIYKGITENLPEHTHIVIWLHNQDMDNFEKLLDDAIGKFDYYILAPHFFLDQNRSRRLARLLSHIPNDKLIILDRRFPEYPGNYGEIYQDYCNDAPNTLRTLVSRIRDFSRIIVLSPTTGLYSSDIRKGLETFLEEVQVPYIFSNSYDSSMMTLGALFIVLGSTIGDISFSILRDCERRGLKLGVAVGLITYNDDESNEFISGGISCITTDFYEMGKAAASMINNDKVEKVHNPFYIRSRNSF